MRAAPAGLKRSVIGIGLLAGTWMALRSEFVQRADVRLGDVVRRTGTPIVDRIVTATTDLGSVYAVLGISAVLAAAGRRDAAADALGLGGAAWTLAQTNKRFVRRKRPYEADAVRRLIRPPTGSSFPSGHAAVGMAVMAIAADRARSRGVMGLFHLLGAYVGASRIYVGVHYPSDVVGGAGLGLLLAGVWRGPIARAGRGGVSRAGRTARTLAPALLRVAAIAVALRVWQSREPRGEPAPRPLLQVDA